jgi:hypothetical protein
VAVLDAAIRGIRFLFLRPKGRQGKRERAVLKLGSLKVRAHGLF